MTSSIVVRLGIACLLIHGAGTYAAELKSPDGKIELTVDVDAQSRLQFHVTREGIRGLEHNKFGNGNPPSHNAALPFTRYLAGPADYTPVTFDPKRLAGTTFAHQLATAFVFTSPVTHFADDPTRYLSSPALKVIKDAPVVWDETIVLPDSDPGELVIFARRSKDRWFLAALNGNAKEGKVITVPLQFLGNNAFAATLVEDDPSAASALDVSWKPATGHDTLRISMSPGGGFTGMFVPVPGR